MTVTLERSMIRELTKKILKLDVIEYRANNPQKGSFIVSDVLGTQWGDAYMPFYRAYGENGKVAGQEIGKVLAVIAAELGFKSMKESRFGKRDAITRYFF